LKKLLCVLCAIMMALPLLTACKPSPAANGGTESGNATTAAPLKPGDNGEVNVYNWGEYINMDIIDEFETATGIKVNYTTFPSNEYLYSNLQTGGYDVIIPSDYMVARLIEEDMLEKLDFANIPNYSLIGDTYKNLEYDPGNAYSVPYMWGTVGILYNPNMVDEEITSWSALWDEKYSGNILQFDNPRDAVATALLYLGYSINTTDEGEIREAFDLLAEQKPLIQKYVMDQIYTLMESGEAAIGPYYAGDYLMMLEANPDLLFVVPEEGSNQYVDAMCVPKGAKNKANGEAFINFMCLTDTCVANMGETGYASPNPEANEAYGDEYDLENEDDLYEYNIIFPSEEVLGTCEVYSHLPAVTNELYNDLWVKLKS